MSYKVSEVITAVRDLIGEINPSGFYSPAFLLEQLNISIRGRVIPDLYFVGKYMFMQDMIVSSDTLKELVVTDDRYDYYDLSGCGSTPFRPSIRAWIDKVRVRFIDVDKVAEYEGDEYAFFRPEVLGAIIGTHLRIYDVELYKWQKISYDGDVGTFTVGETLTGATSEAVGVIVADDTDNDILTLKSVVGVFEDDEEIEDTSGATADVDGDPANCALDMEYIKIPSYSTTGTTVELSDRVIDAFLIPIMCYESMRREPDIPKNKTDAFKLDYTEALKVAAETYIRTVGPGLLPIERIGKVLGA